MAYIDRRNRQSKMIGARNGDEIIDMESKRGSVVLLNGTDTNMTRERLPAANEPRRPGIAPINNDLRVGLALLFQAYCYSRNANVNVWEFALEIEKLYATGLTVSDFRWLVAKEFVEHGRELSVYGNPHRRFQTAAGLYFESGTCAVLTPKGAAFVRRLLTEPVLPPESAVSVERASYPNREPLVVANESIPVGVKTGNGAQHIVAKPHWAPMRRELCLEGTVVKRYRVPARNQEVILSAFEDDGWPEHVDDPLPVRNGVDPKTRLHDAINRLNHSQENPLVRFHGNGSGTGVFWKLRPPVTSRYTDVS
jgi:hypothetical protein